MSWIKAFLVIIQIISLVLQHMKGQQNRQKGAEEIRDEIKKRVDAAADARNRPHDDSVPDKYQRD